MTRERFGKDRHQPPGTWVQTTELFEVAGVAHRIDAVNAWLDAVRNAEVRGERYGVRFAPEPTNAHDKNAIRVLGFANSRSPFGSRKEEEWHIGYVPRVIAAELTELFRKDISIGGELYDASINTTEEGTYVDVRILALAPPGYGLKQRLHFHAVEEGDPAAIVADAKKRGDFAKLEEVLADWCSREVEEVKFGPAPYPFLELAKLFRKQKRFDEELELLEFWNTLPKPVGRTVEMLQKRLEDIKRKKQSDQV